MRLRGHLDKFSDNMFMGAINAYSDDAGKGLNVLTGERGVPFSTIARDYKAKGVKWVVVGDWNYGEGSSREHAVWALADYGFRVVIAPSFADIFYNNCFKNGVLPIKLDEQTVDRLFELVAQNEAMELEVDLESCRIVGDGIEEIAALAQRLNAEESDIGARRLHMVLERLLEPVAFGAPEESGRVEVDAGYVLRRVPDVTSA